MTLALCVKRGEHILIIIGTDAFLSLSYTMFKEIWVSLKIRILFSRTYYQTLEFGLQKKIPNAHWKCCQQLTDNCRLFITLFCTAE